MPSLAFGKKNGLAAFAAAALFAEACSLGNIEPDRCAQSSECASVFGAGSECVNGYCAVGSCDGAVSGRPCYACTPEKREEFLNACTNATCEPFDASRVTKLPADGKLPPLP